MVPKLDYERYKKKVRWEPHEYILVNKDPELHLHRYDYFKIKAFG